MIDPQHPDLSIRRQCELFAVNRNRLKPRHSPVSQEDEEIMKAMDEIHTECPFLGQRKIVRELREMDWPKIGRKRVRRLMQVMGIEALVPKPSLSKPAPGHRIYPYLLRHLKVSEADEVWCADITYIAMEQGHAYLVAVMDWHTRAVLGWEVSNTMDTAFCLRALEQAMIVTGRKPRIFNTDQGSQFTSEEWTGKLKSQGIAVSMDGKGRWMDNVFIERLWRSLKYEKLRLWSYASVPELTTLVDDWIEYYNHRRKHQTLDYATPMSLYENPQAKAA